MGIEQSEINEVNLGDKIRGLQTQSLYILVTSDDKTEQQNM